MHLLQNVFLAMFVCVSTCATAQIPGYMGKRLVIDAEIQAFPALITPTSGGDHLWGRGYQEGTYGLHSRFGIGAGYVLSRHQMVQAHINYLRTGMNISRSTLRPNGVQEWHDLFNVVSGLTFDLAYSRTKPTRGHIAPLGKQRAYHVYMTRVNGTNSLYENGQPVNSQLFGSIDASHTIYGIGYSVTYNKVLNDQFLLTYGWRINMSSPHLWLGAVQNGNAELYGDVADYNLANLNKFKEAAINKFFFYDMMQFKIGFGLLR
jgi:hypothetical protein